MFYIEDNNKIVLFYEDKQKLIDTLTFMPQYKDLEIKEVKEGYTIYNFEIVTDEEARVKSEEYVNYLTMTSLDFINVLRSFGLSLTQIKSYLANNIELDTQLTYCRDVFCGVVRQRLPIKYEGITITDDMIVKAFKSKHNIE